MSGSLYWFECRKSCLDGKREKERKKEKKKEKEGQKRKRRREKERKKEKGKKKEKDPRRVSPDSFFKLIWQIRPIGIPLSCVEGIGALG